MPAEPCILAIDQGTTGTTCLVVDGAGSVVSRGYALVRSTYPRDGWVEQDAEDIWDSVLKASAEALGPEPPPLAGIGIANQRETTILWDAKTDKPLGPAIVWQDRRTARTCEDLIQAGHAELIRRQTGLVIDPYFSATKIAWLLRSDPDIEAAAKAGRARFGTVDSWLVWRLTGGRAHLTDASNASRTMLCDIASVQWSRELTDLFHVPQSLLPRIVPSSGKLALTVKIGPIPGGVIIGGIAGDQQAALFGQACFRPGMVKVTYGTGCFLLVNAGHEIIRSEKSLLTTVAWQLDSKPEYALEGSVFMGGSVVSWLRDAMGLITSSAESEQVAAQVTDTAGVMAVPAFVGLGAPHWNPRARGLVIGLTQKATRAHLVRACLESIAHQVADVAEAMALESSLDVEEVRADGGAAANDLLMQMQADLLDARVLRPAVTETTAMGAAFLAGLATGVWKDKAELASIWKLDREFQPASDPTVAERRRQWSRAVARSLDWAED